MVGKSPTRFTVSKFGRSLRLTFKREAYWQHFPLYPNARCNGPRDCCAQRERCRDSGPPDRFYNLQDRGDWQGRLSH
jgi:hypothetical protein